MNEPAGIKPESTSVYVKRTRPKSSNPHGGPRNCLLSSNLALNSGLTMNDRHRQSQTASISPNPIKTPRLDNDG